MQASSINLLSFDIETTMRSQRAGFSSATPWDPGNKILVTAVCTSDGRYAKSVPTVSELAEVVADCKANSSMLYLVGHNLKFDLNYIISRFPFIYDENMADLPVWDTSIAEYLITGQLSSFPSLKSLCEKYDTATKKSDTLEKAIEAGDTTESINPNDLAYYCVNDTIATLDVALAQMTAVLAMSDGQQLFDLIVMHSNLSKVLAEIECNGMTLSMHTLLESTARVQLEKSDALDNLRTLVRSCVEVYHPVSDCLVLTNNFESVVGSNQWWSAFFFGGEYTLKHKVETGKWKTGPRKGEPRYSHFTTTYTMPETYEPAKVGSERGKDGYWSVTDSVLARLEASGSHIANYLRKYRGIEKLLSTYLTSLPLKMWNGKIHPHINQTVTRTGRLSQSNPNLQNVANVEAVKTAFIPSHPDHCFVEVDYKQLEMVVFAMIYRDANLINDIKAGIDIHALIGRELYGAHYSPDVRRKVKGVNFGMIYGGGWKTLSEQVGLPEAEVKRVINLFNKRYPTIKATRQAFMDDLSSSVKTGNLYTHEGQRYSTLYSSSGRRYSIRMEAKPTPTGISMTPYYTEMCNYPIQGLATGDIVPLMLLHIRDYIRKEKLPVTIHNTVHDSILFEVPLTDCSYMMDVIKRELERVPELVRSMWNLDTLDLPFKVDVKYSKESWNGPWVEWTPF